MNNMLSVIIPAYNEEENIPHIEKELIPVLDKLKARYEVVVVDDGSSDSTAKRVEELRKRHREIVLVKHGINKGLGAAVMTGISHARGDTTVMMDSDFTFHPKDIPKLMDVFEKGADCVIGSPGIEGGKMENVPLMRMVLSKGVNFLYSLIFGRRIKSFSTIFRVYRTEQLKEMKLSSRGFSICAEILFRLVQKKRRIVEVPATLGTRMYGKSKINIRKEMKNNIVFLTKMFFWKIGF